MAEVNVTAEEFRESFPEFSDAENIEIYLARTKCYISAEDYGVLSSDCRKLAIYLFTAHLLTLQKNIAEGQTSAGLTASASIDRVSVSMVPPPSLCEFEYWLNQTLYGVELLSLLSSKLPVPMLLGGSFVRTLF